jgi:hypothetical protein
MKEHVGPEVAHLQHGLLDIVLGVGIVAIGLHLFRDIVYPKKKSEKK